MMTTDERADSIGIGLPREWIEIPVERDRFERFRSELDGSWEQSGWDRTTRRRAELLLNRIRREIGRVGVQFASLYVDHPTDEEFDLARRTTAESGEVGGESELDPDDILMAACIVGVYTRADLGAKIPLTLGNLVMAYGTKPGRDEPGQAKVTNLEPPTIFEMPAGKSVRLRRLYELPQPGMLPQRYYGETFLMPIDEAGDRIAIVNFTTVNLPIARVFSELFEAVAGTVTLFRPDDPTTFESDWVEDFSDDG